MQQIQFCRHEKGKKIVEKKEKDIINEAQLKLNYEVK